MLSDLLLPLAIHRLYVLARDDRGPFAILQILRERIGFEHNSIGEVVAHNDSELAQMVDCPLCFSLWAVLATLIIRAAFPSAYKFIVAWLGASEIAVLLHKVYIKL